MSECGKFSGAVLRGLTLSMKAAARAKKHRWIWIMAASRAVEFAGVVS